MCVILNYVVLRFAHPILTVEAKSVRADIKGFLVLSGRRQYLLHLLVSLSKIKM